MKRFQILLTVELCAALLANCGSSPTAQPTDIPAPAPPPTDTSAPTATLEDSAERHYEPAGGFSYIPPLGWELVETSSIPYKVAREPQAEDFAGNLNVVDESFSGSLDEYITTSLKQMSTYFDGFLQISRDEFQPAEGPSGVRLVVQMAQGGRVLRQASYFFDAGEKRLVFACTRPAEAGEEFDAVCEESVRTFRIESE